jgi:hypothetical protein
VALDKDAGSWFIADSSLRSYDGFQNVRDEECSVGQKKLGRKAEPPSKPGVAWPRWTGFRGKTAWDWLQLLIVPLVLVIGGFLLTTLQDDRQRAIEDQRAQDTAIQAYLDQMGNLLLEKDLRTSKEDSEVRTLARARTLTVLSRFDTSHKEAVIEFLVEAELVQEVEGRGPIIGLGGAQLRDVELFDTDLHGADLSNADLSGTKVAEKQLQAAGALNGAIMPDGSKHP